MNKAAKTEQGEMTVDEAMQIATTEDYVPGVYEQAEASFVLAEEVKQLRGIMRQAAEMVKACGHTESCNCCWCKMRKLFSIVSTSNNTRSDVPRRFPRLQKSHCAT